MVHMGPYRPEGPVRYMPTMSVRMAPGIHREVRDRAARSQISMNSLIVRYIIEGLIRDELAAEAARITTNPDAITDITEHLRDKP